MRPYDGIILHIIRLCEISKYTLQLITGIYGVFAGKWECTDFRIAGFICISAFSINSVGVPFMDFVGKLQVQNLFAIQY